jgi:hypothetical protein
VTVDLAWDDGAARAWLAEFLGPAFRAGPPALRRADHRVAVRVSPGAHAALRRRSRSASLRGVEGFTFDGSFSRHRGWQDASGATWVHDESSDAFYGVGPGAREVDVVARRAGRATRLAAMRVVRELATSALLRAGRLPIHGAAFVVRGTAVVIGGRKRAGKTSLLVHALRCGAGFLGNDRVFADSGRRPRAAGMPTIVMLRDGTLERFPDLRAGFEAARYDRSRTIAECAPGVRRPVPRAGRGFDRPGISGAQLCRLLGARMHGAAPLGAILFPRVDRRARGIVLRRLSPVGAARALAGSLLKPSEPVRASALFTGAGRRPVLSAEAERRLRRRLAARVPAWTCRLGPNAYATDLLPLLERAGVTPSRSPRGLRRRTAGR